MKLVREGAIAVLHVTCACGAILLLDVLAPRATCAGCDRQLDVDSTEIMPWGRA